MNLKKINKKMVSIVGAVLLIFILAIVIILVLESRPKSYATIEERMRKAAIKYYEDNKESLPQNINDKVVVGLNTLEIKYMKAVQKMVKKGVICNGEVRVIKNSDGFLYIPYLNCGNEYNTEELSKVITKNVVTEGNGLYKQEELYIFKGDQVNNYVKFAGKTWRIINVDASGNIKLIEQEKRDSNVWDDRYNDDKGYNIGFNDFLISRMYDGLKSIYEKDFTKEQRANIMSQKLCIGKRSVSEKDNTGKVECAVLTDLEPIGLIQVNEYLNASLDKNCKLIEDQSCQNYNYLNDYERVYWTLTADKDNSYRVYRISTSGGEYANATSYGVPRITLTINSNVIYKSGDGTEKNPYSI